MERPNTQRGAVFIYILMAVALFAALSYAVSRGNRGGTSALTDEQAKLAAQEIIEYGNTVANAVQKLRLRGVLETEISFGNDVYQRIDGTLLNAPGHNANCTNDSCEVFNINGGGITPVTFELSSKDQSADPTTNGKGGHIVFRQVTIDGVGTTAPELTMEVLAIKREICEKINIINNSLHNGITVAETYSPSSFNGTYVSSTANTIGDTTGVSGKTSLCVALNASNSIYLQTLIAR